MIIEFQGSKYPDLGLALAMEALNVDSIEFDRDRFGGIARLGANLIPLDQGGELMINYAGPKGVYPYVSAADAFYGNLASEEIAGKVVLIGSSAAGLYDFHQAVYDTNYPGVETLAVVTGSILEQNYIRRAAWEKEFALLLSIISGLGLALLFSWSSKLSQVSGGTLVWFLFQLYDMGLRGLRDGWS